MERITAEYIAQQLGKAKKYKSGWLCLCPVHDDTDPSLSIKEENGKILVHCFAGCPSGQIINRLKELDLWPSSKFNNSKKKYISLPLGISYKWKGKVAVNYWKYEGADGNILGYVVRYEDKNGNKEVIPWFNKEGGKWKVGAPKRSRPLYKLKDIYQNINSVIVICEGEKSASAAQKLLGQKYVTTTSLGGSNGAKKADWKPLEGRKVIIWPDADTPGIKYAQDVYNKLKSIYVEVLGIVDPIALGFEMGSKKDAADWPSTKPLSDPLPMVDSEVFFRKYKGKGKGNNTSQLDILKQLTEKIEVFHDSLQEGYAKIFINDHYEVWPIKSFAFKQWLGREFYEKTGKVANSQAISEILNVIEARAFFEGEEREVFIRVGYKDNAVYLDLGNEKWEAVEITKEDWRIVQSPPVTFRRPRGMLPLPKPTQNGDIRKLRPFLNIGTEEDWILVVSWLVFSFSPKGCYPILAVHGEHDSGKSTLCKMLRMLIDPNKANMRSKPKNEEDFIITAHNSWIVGLTNLSSIPPWLSDSMCRVATGEGFSTRKLYSNYEEVIFNPCRPQIINGINELISRHDLASRAIFINLPSLEDEKRKEEDAFNSEFEKVRPDILGGLLDAVVMALRNKPHVKLDSKPRMADFALWVVAAEPALPWEEGEFLKAYNNNRCEIIQKSVEADFVGNAILKWFKGKERWEGTVSELLNELEELVGEKIIRQKGWPKNANSLGRKLPRITKFLRSLGIDIKQKARTQNKRIIEITNICDKSDKYCDKKNFLLSQHNSLKLFKNDKSDNSDKKILSLDIKDKQKITNPPQQPCFSCKKYKWWLSTVGNWICENCNPPADESLVVYRISKEEANCNE